MATPQQWVAGARIRTLPAAFSPVVAGTGAAAAVEAANIGRALLALVVAVALQLGVNYSNDYSDGVRGTDDERVGPFRLVGSGAATPAAVRAAAWICFGVAGVTGLILVVLTEQWWLLLIGALAVAAAWFYTGGRSPYGYRGLGEVSVFIFFGLVAVAGTTYVQTERLTATSIISGVAIGLLACAIMLVNNLRDAPTDAASGKRTLAVFLGEKRSRLTYLMLLSVPFALAVLLSIAGRPWALLALLALPMAIWTARPVRHGARGRALIPTLRNTGLTELTFAIFLAIGLALST